MKITPCKIKIKCDMGGCKNLAEDQISLDGEVQMRVCSRCSKKLYVALRDKYVGGVRKC